MCHRAFQLAAALLLVCACQSARSLSTAQQPVNPTARPDVGAATAFAQTSDEQWQRIATNALGDREGAALIIDPQTGHLRASVNPRIAFEQAYPPGSAIKPFTALAVMRAGLLNRETKHQCRTRYERPGFKIVCSHPPSQQPFNLPQALAYSCNDYFARVGERLSEGAFTQMLNSFGFGATTGRNASEAAGSLPRGEWQVQAALGESEQLLVTPIQLLIAYTALVNGGRLYRANDMVAQLPVASEQRAALLEGMRGAIKYGTAATAQLDELPIYVFGKTGTSTASNGWRRQGWFVAFVAEKGAVGLPQPEQIKLGVLVFLKRSHGSECAQVAKEILLAGLRANESTRGYRYGTGSDNDRIHSDESLPRFIPVATATDSVSIRTPQSIKVRSISENVTRELSLETYVAGVLAAEASIESEPEALKAQAVASRTFALKNLGRHAREGYDFCSTTHCQRFVASVPYRRALNAVRATEGETLVDSSGQFIDAYFHAACGGVTADIETLWGVTGAPYLRGVRDEFCAAGPHRRWTQTLRRDELLRALNSDERTQVGAWLRSIKIEKQDATGRAQSLLIEGERRVTVRGWDFKLIVGRALGWQMIKSSRFTLEQRGDDFFFRGSGFGHGLGLCQEGAHGAARRGLDYRRILQFYFPGTRVNRARFAYHSAAPSAIALVAIKARWEQAADASSTSRHFRLRAPAQERAADEALKMLEAAYADYASRLERAGLLLPSSAPLEVTLHATTAEFIAATGQSGWATGATHGQHIDLQPAALLRQRGVWRTTLKHELAHAFIELLSDGRAPRWLAEGLALHAAGEGARMIRIEVQGKLTRVALERQLQRGGRAEQMRRLYALAYREVRGIISAQGEAAAWRLAATYRR